MIPAVFVFLCHYSFSTSFNFKKKKYWGVGGHKGPVVNNDSSQGRLNNVS